LASTTSRCCSALRGPGHGALSRPEQGQLDEKQRDKLLFWFAQAGMWGRYSGNTESTIDEDLAALESGGIDGLLTKLRFWRGGLHRTGTSPAGAWARFYPVLYMLTRMGGRTRDWGRYRNSRQPAGQDEQAGGASHLPEGAALQARPHARRSECLHFCFQTKQTNLEISDRLPEEYFAEFEQRHPGALASQWIPMDKELWKMKHYRDFLEARKELLAAEANQRMEELLHGETHWLEGTAAKKALTIPLPGGIATEAEEARLTELNDWVASLGLPRGDMSYDFADPATGEQRAVFDLAWPNGIQEELSVPVAVLLDEAADMIALASGAGYRCFTSVAAFREYIEKDILALEQAA
jgi:hypothetical protein